MKSGMIVDRRDQVLMTCLLFFSFCTSTFLSRWSSTNGPFFRLRGMCYSSTSLIARFLLIALRALHRHRALARVLLAGAPASDDELVTELVRMAGTPFLLAPRADRVTATRGLTLAATVRVIDRVHDHAADRRALALPPHPTGLAPVDVCLLGVADLADRCAAAHVDAADLTAGHPQRRVAALLAEQLDARPGRPREFGATTRPQLHGVDQGTRRDVAHRQVVARLDVGVGAGLHHIAPREPKRCNDVTLFPVKVVQQRDVGGAVRVVFDVCDLRVDTVFVVAAEVDHPVGALVATTPVTGGDAPVGVTATLAVQRA